MNFLESKKGQGMSTNTIVLLILGVLVLVVLILGFTMGWSRIAPFLSQSNVDDIVTSCESACTLNSKYDYCSQPRMLKDAEKNEVEASCLVLAEVEEFSLYGIKSCEIECDLSCENIKVNEGVGEILAEGDEGMYDLTGLASDLSPGEVCLIQ
jgi:hypothetical protein